MAVVNKNVCLEPLAPFEARLLHALAFFRTGRNVERQALHCLSMYLRQSEGRIMSEVSFYAKRLGLSTDDLLEAIYTEPKAVQDLFAVRFPELTQPSAAALLSLHDRHPPTQPLPTQPPTAAPEQTLGG